MEKKNVRQESKFHEVGEVHKLTRRKGYHQIGRPICNPWVEPDCEPLYKNFIWQTWGTTRAVLHVRGMEYKKSHTSIVSPRVVPLYQGGTPRPIEY